MLFIRVFGPTAPLSCPTHYRNTGPLNTRSWVQAVEMLNQLDNPATLHLGLKKARTERQQVAAMTPPPHLSIHELDVFEYITECYTYCYTYCGSYILWYSNIFIPYI